MNLLEEIIPDVVAMLALLLSAPLKWCFGQLTKRNLREESAKPGIEGVVNSYSFYHADIQLVFSTIVIVLATFVSSGPAVVKNPSLFMTITVILVVLFIASITWALFTTPYKLVRPLNLGRLNIRFIDLSRLIRVICFLFFGFVIWAKVAAYSKVNIS